MLILIAWRNIWRNPRRTAVVLAAVVIGVWSMVFSSALVRGLSNQMVRTGISTLTGHIQVRHRGYRNDPTIENSMAVPPLAALKDCLPPGALWTGRVRVNAVASNARHADGVTLVGIDPAREQGISFLPSAALQGAGLDAADATGIVIGRALADRFETRVGHKLILMSQDTGKNIASRAFRIVGIYRAGSDSTEGRYVFIRLPEAQGMLGLGEGLSEASIVLPEMAQVDPVAARLREQLPAADYEVHTWRELLPLIVASVAMYDSMIRLWNLVAFVAMGFGIVNTILMAVLERTREFGLLRALGMKPGGIIREVLTEAFFLLLIGMAIGNALGFASSFALGIKGLDLASLTSGLDTLGMPRIVYPVVILKDVLWANGVVLILGLLVSCYPAIRATRITPIEALAST